MRAMARNCRRAAAWLLALTWILLCAGSALAEAAGMTDAAVEAQEEPQTGWREGMSPAKPYEGVPEVDLTERLGYMLFYPTDRNPAENACQELCLYLPREDVKAGEGKLYLGAEGEKGALWSTPMNDADAVVERPMTESEKQSLLWGSGTCFVIKLPKSLELGKTYFVNMERGCIWTEDGKIDNPEVGGTKTWRFTLGGDYGVSGMEYRRRVGDDAAEAAEESEESEVEYETGILKPTAGDEIRFDLTLGGDAAMAMMYGYNESVNFTTVMYEESAEVVGEVLEDNPAWGVMFLDVNGDELTRVEFY